MPRNLDAVLLIFLFLCMLSKRMLCWYVVYRYRYKLMLGLDLGSKKDAHIKMHPNAGAMWVESERSSREQHSHNSIYWQFYWCKCLWSFSRHLWEEIRIFCNSYFHVCLWNCQLTRSKLWRKSNRPQNDLSSISLPWCRLNLHAANLLQAYLNWRDKYLPCGDHRVMVDSQLERAFGWHLAAQVPWFCQTLPCRCCSSSAR